MTRTAFVLGGARNLGALQVGMLEALVERQILPDLVVGCSVGALNGAALAADPTAEGVGRLRSLWLSLSRRDVWATGPSASLVGLLRRGEAVNGGARLRRVVEGFGPADFADLVVPFACVAASLRTGRERWFTEGPLVDAVLASAAVPGLLPPVVVDGDPLVDGAVVNTVPVLKAVELGADRLFVLQIKDLDTPSARVRRPLDVVVQSFAASRNARFRHELATVPPGVEVVVLPVVAWPRLRYDGFSRTAELVDRSREAAARHLDGRS